MEYPYHIDTLPQPVQELLAYYFKRLEEEDVDSLSAFCLMGSLGLNDFRAGKSDIDFCAVMKDKLPDEEAEVLNKIHTEIDARFDCDFNGFYIRKALIEDPELEDRTCHAVFNNKLYKATRPESYQTYNYQLQHASKLVYGIKPNVNMLFDALIRQRHIYVNTFWVQWLKERKLPSLKSWQLLTDPNVSEFGILNAGRNLYLLRTKDFLTKTAIGKLLLADFPMYEKEISEALSTRDAVNTGKSASYRRYRQTHRLIQQIIDTFNQEYRVLISS